MGDKGGKKDKEKARNKPTKSKVKKTRKRLINSLLRSLDDQELSSIEVN